MFNVLILVVMEYALGDEEFPSAWEFGIVLILVVMEYALGVIQLAELGR